MVSAATVRKLSQDVGTLAEKLAPKKPFKAIKVHLSTFSDRQAVLKLHEEMFPEDCEPDVVMVWTMIDADLTDAGYDGPDRFTGDDPKKADAAWKSLARQESAAMTRQQLSQLWLSRAIAHAMNVAAVERPFAARDVGRITAKFGISKDEGLAMLERAGIDTTNAHVRELYQAGRSDHVG